MKEINRTKRQVYRQKAAKAAEKSMAVAKKIEDLLATVNKGVRGAKRLLKQAVALAQKWRWTIKLDVSAGFPIRSLVITQ